MKERKQILVADDEVNLRRVIAAQLQRDGFDVFTVGEVSRPRSTAFLANNPAPIMTDGFEVLVQEVIAAIATDP